MWRRDLFWGAAPVRQCRRLCTVLMVTALMGCTGLPANVPVVNNFELQRYLGTWYEIARLDHEFERGLERVSAEYTPREGGGVVVRNRGYNPRTGEWESVEGKAFLLEEQNVGRLKVSFFGPFYASYNIIELDEQYQHALVCGPDRSYLWVLARERDPDPAVIERLVARARALGFATEALIEVDQGI